MNNNDKIKRYVTSLLQPAFDQLVDNFMIIYTAMEKNLPANMTLEQKQKVMEDVIKSYSDGMTNSIKNAVPSDFAEQLKKKGEQYGK